MMLIFLMHKVPVGRKKGFLKLKCVFYTDYEPVIYYNYAKEK